MGRRGSALALASAIAIALLRCKSAPAESLKPEPKAEEKLSTKKLVWKAAPTEQTDVATLVLAELAKAKADGRRLVVYVGATWCEPCQKFHHAASAGELDSAFPDITFLEFDADRDKDRLEKAGYGSYYIPLFAVPDAQTGKASPKKVAGGIKGEGVVPYLTTKIRSIL